MSVSLRTTSQSDVERGERWLRRVFSGLGGLRGRDGDVGSEEGRLLPKDASCPREQENGPITDDKGLSLLKMEDISESPPCAVSSVSALSLEGWRLQPNRRRGLVCFQGFYCISRILCKLAADLGDLKLLEMAEPKVCLPSLRSSSPRYVLPLLTSGDLSKCHRWVWPGGTQRPGAMASSLPRAQVSPCPQPGRRSASLMQPHSALCPRGRP